MAVIIRTAFNNQDWTGQCQNADRDRRLFQCRKAVIDIKYKTTDLGQCAAECWEQKLCSDYKWYSTAGNFGEQAEGNAYFVYRDVDRGTLVLWGKSEIKEVKENSLTFKRFKPLSDNEQVRGLTYQYLESIGVPKWGSGTFRYISEKTASVLDSLIESDETLIDLSEEAWDTEGRLLLKRHITKERSAKLIRAFKAQLTDYSCAVCGFLFQRTYGTLGTGFIEAHHTIPIATLTEQTKMSVSDLIAVCSNCHRMLHRSNPPFSVEKLQSEIKIAVQQTIPPDTAR